VSKSPLQALRSGLPALEGFSKLVISKEVAKTLSLIFSSTKRQKIYYYNSLKKYSSRETIPLILPLAKKYRPIFTKISFR
jgi:hypothetical protein